MDVLEKAQKLAQSGKRVIHLEVGEPDFETPACVKDAACRAIRDGKTGYTHSLGIIELRESIAQYYHDRYRVSVHPDQIVVTPGTSPAMLMSFSAVIEPGDRVMLTDPHYACYPNFVRFAHGQSIHVRSLEEEGFQFRSQDAELIRQQNIKAVVINSPSNPTGTLLPDATLQALCASNALIFSDEIYHGLVYEGRERSALEFTDNCFVFNGFSKLFAMTGWRLGYVIAPRPLMPVLQKMQQSFLISTCSVAQWAGVAALHGAWNDVARMKQLYDDRRRYIVGRLRELGFGLVVEPKGAFYVFVNARHFGMGSVELAFDILDKIHVGVTPGVDFGPNGEGYLRFSYANSLENIVEAMDRLELYCNARKEASPESFSMIRN